jgi:hypothetical protein
VFLSPSSLAPSIEMGEEGERRDVVGGWHE